jgi:hypothetical protein
MKKNISNKLAIAVCLLVMGSCKARKPLVVVPVPVTPPANTNKPVNPIDAIKAQQLNYNTFAAKSSTTLDIDGNSNDVTLNIRINRDKKIWVSVTALLGIEVARALITPDSVLVINKLQHVYIKKPFSFIHAYASKQINYKTLEALLVGNAMPGVLNDNRTVIAPADNGNTTLSGNLQDLVYKLLLNPGKKAAQLNLSNPAEAQTLQVINYTFIQVDNKVVPSQIDIQSAIKSKKIKVNLQYSKVDFDQQLDYPFNIPESYSPAD